MSATILLAANPLPLSLTSCLEDLGYEVVMAEDGRSVLGFLQHQTPDLLILDATTLMASGLDVCKKLKCVSGQRDLSVVMTSTLSGVREQSAAQLVGAKVVLDRPKAGEVAAMVEGLLDTIQMGGQNRAPDTAREDARLWRTAS